MRAGSVFAGSPCTWLTPLLVLALLAGCSPPSTDQQVQRDPAARATLDQDSGEILMPLSDYDLIDTNHDIEVLNHAFRLFVGACMEDLGFAYSAARLGDENRVVDDRQYGIWYEPTARVYGFDFPPSVIDEALEIDRSAGGQAWIDAEMDCTKNAEKDLELSTFMPTNEELNDSLVPTIRTEAYRLASADAAWQAAREKWWDCLRAAGLEPLTGATDWGTTQDVPASVSPEGKPQWTEETIRAAFAQAQCNNQTGLAQTIGDLEASYQAPLIDKNQAALNEWKEDKQQRLSAAADYITRHG